MTEAVPNAPRAIATRSATDLLIRIISVVDAAVFSAVVVRNVFG